MTSRWLYISYGVGVYMTEVSQRGMCFQRAGCWSLTGRSLLCLKQHSQIRPLTSAAFTALLKCALTRGVLSDHTPEDSKPYTHSLAHLPYTIVLHSTHYSFNSVFMGSPVWKVSPIINEDFVLFPSLSLAPRPVPDNAEDTQ